MPPVVVLSRGAAVLLLGAALQLLPDEPLPPQAAVLSFRDGALLTAHSPYLPDAEPLRRARSTALPSVWPLLVLVLPDAALVLLIPPRSALSRPRAVSSVVVVGVITAGFLLMLEEKFGRRLDVASYPVKAVLQIKRGLART